MNRFKSAVGVAVIAALAAGPSFAIRDLQGTDPSVIRTKCTTRWGFSAPASIVACVAMGIADYCSANRSYTQTGTPILFYDFDVPGHAPARGADHWFEWDESTPLMSFEAGWAAGGAIGPPVLSHPPPQGQGFGRPICLSKKRWATLPIGGPCPSVLPDPRKDPKARFCEDLIGAKSVSVDALEVDDPSAIAALRSHGALVFNKSAFLDRGLLQWTDGTHYYATSAGFAGGAHGGDVPPAPGYRAVTTSEPLIGVVLTDELRWFVTSPDALLASSPLRRLGSVGLQKLTTYDLGRAGFVTSTRPMGGRAVRVEGWVFKTEADVRNALPALTPAFAGTPKQLIQFKTRDGRFALATHSPGPEWIAGESEGWILRGGR